MSDRTTEALRKLEGLKFQFEPGLAGKKLKLLERLRGELNEAADVERLHDQLYFMRAYPDDRKLLREVERMLAGFSEREDLDYFREDLANSGIAGTEILYPFFWFTLRWLVRRCPDRLHIDWEYLRGAQRKLLDRWLMMLMPYAETLALEEATLPTRQWIEMLKGPAETDAEFVVRRFEAMKADPLPRESIFETIDIPFRLLPGPNTPALTNRRHESSPIVPQKRPLVRSRDTFRKEIDREPDAIRSVGRREARELIDLSRTLMVSRLRDLDAFVHADENDVRILDYPEGFQIVCLGTIPERRQMLDAAYGFLMLRNGVLIGYVLSASLLGSAEAAYNMSPQFRGAEAAHLYGRSLGAVRTLFGADTFAVDPYQMGHDNPEGLRSGAWWFYYKLGFRPRDAEIARLAETEQRKVRERPGYRSSLVRLNRLSSVNMYLHLGPQRDDIMGELARENVGLRIVRYLAERFGADRERGIETCSREVARWTGLRSLSDLSVGELVAWRRWAPMIRLIPGVGKWPEADRKALARVIRAKGGRRESDFVARFDRHVRLRRAILQLAAEPPG